jgi:hypothetical protein
MKTCDCSGVLGYSGMLCEKFDRCKNVECLNGGYCAVNEGSKRVSCK